MNLKKIQLRKVDNGLENWCLFIPASRPEHYEAGEPVSPYGDSYWPRWTDAIEFLETYERFETSMALAQEEIELYASLNI